MLASANKTAQAWMERKKPTYTHALLCLNAGHYIEATFGAPLLSFDYTDRSRTSLDSEEWKALRYKPFSSEHNEKLFAAVMTHVGKTYNLVNQSDATFCSCFIAMAYNAVFPDLFADPQRVLPVTLEHLPRTDWEDVTDKYQTESRFRVNDDWIKLGVDNVNLPYYHSVQTVQTLETLDDLVQAITGKKRTISERSREETEGFNWVMQSYFAGKKLKQKTVLRDRRTRK